MYFISQTTRQAFLLRIIPIFVTNSRFTFDYLSKRFEELKGWMASACCRSTFAASWGELFPKESERLLCLLALSSFVTASIKIFLPSIRLVSSFFSKRFTKRCEKLWQRSKVDEQRKREGEREEPCEDEYMKSPVHGIRYIES